jgi:hypothetical protein
MAPFALFSVGLLLGHRKRSAAVLSKLTCVGAQAQAHTDMEVRNTRGRACHLRSWSAKVQVDKRQQVESR